MIAMCSTRRIRPELRNLINHKIPEASLDKLRALIAPHLNGNERAHGVHGTCLVAPGLAQRAASDVFDAVDKDGLVPLGMLDPIAPGVFRLGDVVLFAHPGFRSSLSRWNSLNAYLFDELQRLAGEATTTVKVRLDPDMVGLRTTIIEPMEWAYWYGPHFADTLETIPPGLTVHVADESLKFYHSISRTEFWWQSRDGQHIFEAEELRDQPTFSEAGDRYGCRYIHSIVDETTKQIIHLDGAVREYSEEGLVERLDKKLADAGRQTDYTKLWRVDGAAPLTSWKMLVHHHFRDNDLVAEYLEPAAGHRAEYRGAEAPDTSGPSQVRREQMPEVQLQLSLSKLAVLNDARELGPLRYLSKGRRDLRLRRAGYHCAREGSGAWRTEAEDPIRRTPRALQ